MPPDQQEGFNSTDRRNSGTDHDALVSLVASTTAFHAMVNDKLAEIKADIRDLKDGVKTSIADHEVRINKLESSKGNQTILISIGIGILSLLAGLMTYHMIK